MNNVTRENSINSISAPQDQDNDREDPCHISPEGQADRIEQPRFPEVLNLLDQISHTPRTATIRAIMNYAHKKNEVIH